MRLNKYVASSLGISRRQADEVIKAGLIKLNGQPVDFNFTPSAGERLTYQNAILEPNYDPNVVLMLNKPLGFVCSRNGQGSNTIYDILPKKYHHLNPIGRLDKNSSGLLLMTNDGQLHQQLSHPKYEKQKVYQVLLDESLDSKDAEKIVSGVKLSDGISHVGLESLGTSKRRWVVAMHEGRNRQIRRTFASLGYKVKKLHRTSFGPYELGELESGEYKIAAKLIKVS
ncbi:rRNA pseudouridine synthase [Candidatus Nomurabacteria bacterium]|jgi:23S rRNA pseudouridine2605 synthase|nr:rRNA pseudouridine synthase [Candidatus Saccharibacteria bacterium]MCB9839627.1 rRNA pseudouridine synthase [Candidatus Nomurabacteria bacterium]